jgi:hypothetical protein
MGIPISQIIPIPLPWKYASPIKMGNEKRRLMNWAKTTARMRKCFGKRTFFMRFTLLSRLIVDMVVEAENQFQGKRAERKKKR